MASDSGAPYVALIGLFWNREMFVVDLLFN